MMDQAPKELEALIRAARNVPGPAPDVAERLVARLDAVSVGAPTTGATPAGQGTAGTASAGVTLSKTMLLVGGSALLLLGAAAGGGVVWTLRGEQVGVAKQVVVAAPPAPSAPAIEPLAARPTEPVATVVALPEPKVQIAPPVFEPRALRQVSRPAPAESTLELERRLLETARSAVVAGAFGDALSAVDEHAKRFPHGALAEEREALAIQALSNTDPKAAASRAARFRTRWPSSIFEPVVEKAVAGDGSSAPPQ
jgi:hypothetical protein